jgi:hypothetical protein
MDSTDDEDDRIITSNWMRLAGLAWEKYSEQGRGVVALDFSAGADGELVAVYLAESSPEFQKISSQFAAAELAESVSTYDPREGVVFVFIRPGAISFSDVEHTPAPPAAWQLLWASKLESSKPN